MGLIKDIHTDIQNDDLDSLQTHTSPPILPVVLSAKDSNGLTPLHKAAGLGRYDIAKYIVETYPDSVNSLDNDGRSPLHFSTLAKDNGQMFDFLIESGANESLLDNKQKTAAYYKNRNSEIDGKLLLVIPECPRTAKDGFASNFDWSMLSNSEIIAKPVKKIKELLEEPAEIKVEEDYEEKQNTEVPENETKEDVIENTVIDDAVEVVAVETPVEVDVEIETQADAEAPVEEVVQNGDVENVDEPETEILELVEENTVVANKDEVEVVPELEDIADGNIVDELVIEDSTTPTNEIMDNIVEDSVDNKVLEINENENVEEKIVEKEAELLKSVVEAEGVIEGVVNGENEIESVNEQGQGVDDKEDDPEVVALIEEGNMEVLAALVLNGDGDKLVGYRSENPELQAFLDNVPTYMSKINKIHAAARDGSLRDLQAALDRRKFAIAKDHISPNGTSPLHVATIFGNTSIVRYLAGRFPETVLAVDDNGRTPLHYAATLDDNGHYYNLLVHLGADSRAEDKFGNTADYYRSNQGELSHRSLLLEFGAEETVADIVNDKDKSTSKVHVDMPFFYTEEGRYLASSLGDPLIKGLTEVANKRPDDPIAYLATYLYNFANNDRSRVKTQEIEEVITGPPEDIDNNNAVPTTIEVVTVEPDSDNSNEEESAFNKTSRDEHGQSMLHFAAARSHGRNALFQLLLETEMNISYRDELYRTARDISIQANIPENTNEIDRYILHIACNGETDKLVELLMNGYDHITDVVDEDDIPIVEAVSSKGQADTVTFLQSILTFEEKRERVHHAIRQGASGEVFSLLADEKDTGSGKLLAIGKNSYGRCALHIAVLCQQEEIVDYLVNTFPETLHIGDNLERTALHYSMGVEKMETINKLLIHGGAKRVAKDLKGRQPTYYFMNKSDILRLQEEEETF